MTEQQFGKKGGQQANICSDIMAKTGNYKHCQDSLQISMHVQKDIFAV